MYETSGNNFDGYIILAQHQISRCSMSSTEERTKKWGSD